MKRMMLCLTALFALGASSLEAQGTGKPFCPAGISATEMAGLIRAGNLESRCNITADQLMFDTNTRLAELGANVRFSTHRELADFVGGLQQVRCTAVVPGQFQMSRLLPSGLDNSGNWQRSCREGEMLLCDGNLGLCIFSEYCWNTIQSDVTLPAVPVAYTPPVTPFMPPASDTLHIVQDWEVAFPNEIQVVIVDDGPGFCGGNWLYVCGAALAAGGWAIYECATDWCTTENENRTRIRINMNRTTGFSIPFRFE